jgi:hypothetical protein
MTLPSAQFDDLADLVWALANERLDADAAARLQRLLDADAANRRIYIELMDQFAALEWEKGEAARAVDGRREADELGRGQWTVDSESAMPHPAFPSTIHYPLSATSSFVGSPLFSYLIAAVILGIGLLVAAVTHVSQPAQVVRQNIPSPSGRGAWGEGGERRDSSHHLVVGQITGMVDCEFAPGSKTEAQRPKTDVSFGDKFALSSGLLEITYDTGARVILQGPVTYTIESPAAGYLSVGKLTARLEKAEGGNQTSEIRNPPSPFHLPPSTFVIRTPTAVVTDLGTEFGVDVTRSGETTSHVFRGSVRVQRIAADGTMETEGRVVRENQTVRVDPSPGKGQIITLHTFTPSRFVRQIPKVTGKAAIKTFDLVDVVAGGDGFSGRRNAGIDPTNGRMASVPLHGPQGEKSFLVGDGKYHRVLSSPFVDGVFIPDARRGPVQVDSAGHLFVDCPETSNLSSLFLWAGAAVLSETSEKLRTQLGDVDYASAGHGLLFMHANKGITFDLQAIRRAISGSKFIRFRAVTGNTSVESEQGEPVSSDIWVLVDGKVRFKRREINMYTGAMPIGISLTDADRFLTLVATDGGNGIRSDWIIFGDPRLELLPASP